MQNSVLRKIILNIINGVIIKKYVYIFEIVNLIETTYNSILADGQLELISI